MVRAQRNLPIERDRLLERLQLQLEAMPIGCIVCATDLTVLDWNPAAERIFGFRRGEILGRSAYGTIVPLSVKPRLDPFIGELLRGHETRRMVNESLTKDGRTILCEWHDTPLRAPSGEVLGLMAMVQDVTEQRRADEQIRSLNALLEARMRERTAQLEAANQELQRSSAELAALYDRAPCGYHTLDAAGRLLRINDTELGWLGYTREEILGRPIRDLLAPTSAPLYEARFGELQRRGGLTGLEVEYLRKDGSIMPTLLNAVAVTDADGAFLMCHTTLIDLTERKRVERELQLSRERFELAASGAVDGLWDWNAATDEHYFSDRFCELLGYRPGELLPYGSTWTNGLIHPDDREHAMAAVRRHLRARTPYDVEYRMRTKSGAYRWFRATGQARWDEAGHATRMAGSVVDVTERRQREEEIRDLNRVLAARAAELEQAVKELESFSYSVSHDLRSPLRAIDGFSRAVLDNCADRLDESSRDDLRRVRAAGQRMGNLIDDLLALSRVARSEVRRRPVDLSEIVRAIAGELRRLEPERAVEFHITPGLVANADADLIRVALDNLLGNAWKFTARQPAAHITFGAAAEGDTVYFVRDDGAGFEMRYVDKLFRPFERLHAIDDFEGTGIGLATVQRIVQRHGGRVWAEAAVDRGATFYFTLAP